MSKIVEIFCLECKEVFKYKRLKNNLHEYSQGNYIMDGNKKIKCTCGSSKLKFDGYLKKEDVI